MEGGLEVSFYSGITWAYKLQAEHHDFEHNTFVSRVTPESIPILFFSSITRQILILGKRNRRRKKSRQGKQQLSSLLAQALISGLLPGNLEEERGRKLHYPTEFLAQTPCTQCWMQLYHRPKSYTRPNLISRPKPDLIDESKSGKPHLQAATVSACNFFPRKKVRALSYDI